MPNFIDDDHALQAGVLIGTFLKMGLKVEIQADAEGNYTNTPVVLIENVDPSRAPWRIPVTIHPATT